LLGFVVFWVVVFGSGFGVLRVREIDLAMVVRREQENRENEGGKKRRKKRNSSF